MISHVRLGFAESPHGVWIAGWVKEQLLHDHPAIDIQLIPVSTSLTDFARPDVLSAALQEADLVVADGSFLPTFDPSGVVVAAVCERADPRHCIIGDGNKINVWHPGLASILSVTDPSVVVTIQPTLIDVEKDVSQINGSESYSTMMPMHAISRISGQRLSQTPVEAEDVLPICGQGAVLVYSRESDTELGTLVFNNLNAVDTRREVTVERYFKAQLKPSFHDSVCCYSTGSDRFLYLFVTLVVEGNSYKTRSGAHISAMGSIVEQAITDLEKQSGVSLRATNSS